MSSFEIAILILAFISTGALVFGAFAQANAAKSADDLFAIRCEESQDNDDHWATLERLVEDRIAAKFAQWSSQDVIEAKRLDFQKADAQLALQAGEHEKRRLEISKLEAEARVREANLKIKEREIQKIELLAKLEEKNSAEA